jgi:tellurite resistance protein TerC
VAITSRTRSLIWVVGWFVLSVAIGVWILATQGSVVAAEYFAAYFLEESLSVDNIFVFILIFAELQIPAGSQRRVLRFGVIGALVFRAIMIGAGIALIGRFSWITYPFAVLILFAAWRMLFGQRRERQAVQAACNVCESWIARLIPITPVIHGGDFWRRQGGRLVATPLFVALVVIETTDIVFALDSVPAVLSVTRNPFVVYTSNVMAMFGLRSLYFVLTDVLHRLRYLRQGVALLLVFTGAKMLTHHWLPIGAGTSVVVILIVLLGTIGLSLLPSETTAASTPH